MMGTPHRVFKGSRTTHISDTDPTHRGDAIVLLSLSCLNL